MKNGFLLDTSFLIDLDEEAAARCDGPATRTLAGLGAGVRLYVSPVTVAELLEGAEDAEATERALSAYRVMTIGWGTAVRCALAQARAPRRMGENDAWQAALAIGAELTLIGHDRIFENRPRLAYLDHRA